MRSGIAAGLALALVVACAPVTTPQATKDPLAGTYVVAGGGAPLDVFNALASGFEVYHPTVRFQFNDVGSAAGMKLAASGGIDLATSSATPAPEIAASLTLVPVGASGTAVIVNAQNTVTTLTKAQVRAIFSGTETAWSGVGGSGGKIIVVVREATSALRSNFDSYFFEGKGTYAKDAIELNSGDDVLHAVAGQSEVVGMITVDSRLRAEPRVRALAIDGVAPTKENVVAGRYPVRRPLFLVYNEKLAKPAVTAFIAYVKSDEGKTIVDRVTVGG